MATHKLIYFNFTGRAEPCRLCCAIGGLPLEEERLDFAEFGARKAKGEFPVGQVPVLVVGGETFCQSNAILRYFGTLTGLYPQDDIDALRVDQVLDTCEEVISHTAPTIFISNEEERKAARKNLVENVFPKYAKALDNWCESGHVIKGRLTIGDLAVQNVVNFLTEWDLIDFIPKDFFASNYPNCQKVHDMVKSLPEVKAYQLKYGEAKEETEAGKAEKVIESKAEILAKEPQKKAPKLVYFNFTGRAEPCRLACAIGGIQLEEERLDFAEFGARKAKGEFPVGSVPCLEMNGEKFCQSNSILRYLGKQIGLYPKNPLHALKVDQVLDVCEEMIFHTAPTIFISDEEKRKAARKNLTQTVLPKYVKALDKWCEGGHVIKDQLTVADLAVQNIVHFLTCWDMVDHIPKDYFKVHGPNCVTVYDTVKALPKVKAYQAKEDECKSECRAAKAEATTERKEATKA
jgi:glutathione S-transferase